MTGEGFWVYDNWTNKAATVHRGSCVWCNDGRGTRGRKATAHGEWLGPFKTAAQAWARAERTRRETLWPCRFCKPMDEA